MGFEGVDFEVIADMGEVKQVNALGIDVLQLPTSWIFLPLAVEFYSSDDGIKYNYLSTYYPYDTEDIRPDGPAMFSRSFDLY